MCEGIDIVMIDLPKSNLDTVLKAIETLLLKTNHIQDFVVTFSNDHRTSTLQFVPIIIFQGLLLRDSMMFPSQKENESPQNLNTQKLKKVKINPSRKVSWYTLQITIVLGKVLFLFNLLITLLYYYFFAQKSSK